MKKPIKPGQLRVGIFVYLDVSWMNHSFMLNSFKIKNEDQIAELNSMGLAQIFYDPARSDVPPLPLEKVAEPSVVTSVEQAERDQKMWEEKQSRIKKMKEKRVRMNRCEKQYAKTVSSVRKVIHSFLSRPKEAVEAVDEMVSDMLGTLMEDKDTTLHLVNMKGKSESAYYHSINVSILALMFGKQLGLDALQLHHLGTGALFHDLGHTEVPDKILKKTGPLSKAEQDFYRMHTVYGERLARKTGSIPEEAIEIIVNHHEMVDGSGYPKGLKGDQLSDITKIVSLVNDYDNLCNKIKNHKSSTPYEAMSILYSRNREKYDEDILTTFITNMGVYPPGTVVKLSNDSIATVISISPNDLLSPSVMVYDPQIPKAEVLIIDLTEEDLSIVEGVSRSSLPKEVIEYLDISDNVNVYFDNPSGKK